LHAVVRAGWTTDAPFRETAQAIEAAQSLIAACKDFATDPAPAR
jgi:hypothetical protein